MKSGSIAIVLTAAAAVFVVAAGAAVSAGQGLFSSDGDGAVWVVEEDDGAYLGVRLREETDHPEGGALVTRVLEDSPAARAGLEQGDIILQFDDEVIRGPAALTKRIRSKEAGDRVSLTVQRDGDRQVLDVELGARSEGLFPGPRTFSFKSGDWQEVQEDLEDRMAEVRERLGEDGLMRWNFEPGQQFDVAPGFRFHWGRPRLGVQLIETTPELRQHLGADAAAGVLVSKVLVGTPAEHAGIAVGDLIVEVDGKSIGNTGDLVEALAEKVGETFTIRLIRDNDEKSVEVTLPEQDDEPVTGPRARAPRPRSSARHVAPMPVPLPAAPAPVRAPAAVAPPAPAAVAPPAPAAVAPPAPAMPPAPPAPPAPSSARRFV